ncbi:MAG: CPBP family intramembrane metalloprotease [Pyrinomonadaceae bacterium]|nr:CPBP family intramembrane metalloprotease [Acidobacteriota bacterium]MBK7934827.1 CPBP family intramembrane metalloprotease [Acidobacteriota bacterium]MBP7375205.1 CPBP family intramembrane metalloprotease [Pyrinomonadaceae bacterium]
MNKRFVISFVVVVIYLVIILVGAKLEVGDGTMRQAEMVSRQISISLILGLIFLIGVVRFFGWSSDSGLTPIRSTKSLLILWLPVLFILVFFILSVLLGFPPAQAILFVGINTLLVGISEELAFRGILFSGARSALRPIGAITLTSVIFGAVHVFNGFTTGDWGSAAVQAVAAAMSGLLFIAILIRTGSIIPAMIIHWLWDFGIFALGSRGGHHAAPAPADPTVMSVLAPILFVMPNFLYALWLLRGIGNKSNEEIMA